KAESVTPCTMALIAKYVARHRLRDARLLDTIADFLVKKAEFLDSKVIQKLVFPFSRMSYRPSNQQQFFSRLEEVVELKALSSPLATVNILMSLFQLGHFPGLVLHRVFSSAFISNVTNSPYALIVRRYLSLLDAAVELEFREYSGPRLQDAHKVLMFDHALTADEVNRKYSYKGLVAEALRQLLGEHKYRQDQVLPPGYYTDFLLWMNGPGQVLPIRTGPGPALSVAPPSDVLYRQDSRRRGGVRRPPAPLVIVSVNDKWHYCHNCEVLVGSRAMRDRHLRLLGYVIVQLPYHELEKLNGIEEVKQYLHKKLLDVPLFGGEGSG
uniref:Fas-activated serine/threonine kinase n=1 Tax=Tetraodon nigroviridis TaxID=99883 RepID=H3CBL7_TETNG